jgi:hypothetical protein
MNNKELKSIKEKLSILKDQPLRFTFRGADMLCLQFGRVIEKTFRYQKDENGKPLTELAGEYALHIQCFYRLSCGNEIILAKSDLYEPSSIILNKPDFDWDSFDYDDIGNNRLDEIIATRLNELEGFIVDTIQVTKFGDIIITFTNGFLLEGYSDDSSKDSEFWRFFKSGLDEPHLVINGTGIEKDDEPEEKQ